MRASWLIVVFAACVCCPAAGALCWESSICSDLRSKERLLDCISLCASRLPAAFPTQHPSPNTPENEGGLLLDLLLSSLGGPQDRPPLGPGARGRGEDRRSYAMEHFRWGKPPGRKRRPVKVYAASGEEARDVSVEGGDARQERQSPRGGAVAVGEEEGGGGGKEVVLDARDLEVQPMQGSTFAPQTESLSQEMKDAVTYRMSHFRWGSPPKRRDGFLTPWEENTKKPLSRFFGSSFKLVH